MEFITIKKDQNLKIICDFLEEDADVFIENTLNYLGQNEWIFDASEEWGRTIGEALFDRTENVLGISILCLNTNNSDIIYAFLNLKIVGFGDCPCCGAEMEKFEDE